MGCKYDLNNLVSDSHRAMTRYQEPERVAVGIAIVVIVVSTDVATVIVLNIIATIKKLLLRTNIHTYTVYTYTCVQTYIRTYIKYMHTHIYIHTHAFKENKQLRSVEQNGN